jgi:phosphohistidine phosphatase
MSAKRMLYIVRHGKSAWDFENISDIDRPLKLRGIRNAYEMARRLKINRNIPEYFISSPANRALHTATIFMTVFEKSFANLRIDQKLYGNGPDSILELVKKQPAEVKKLALFGHNPDFSQLAGMFAKEPIYELHTCGIAIFTFNCDSWGEISKKVVTGELYDFPDNE